MAIYRDKSPDNITELKKGNLSTNCPHCGADIIAEPISDPVNNGDYSYFVAMCPHHKDYSRHCEPFFVMYQSQDNYVYRRYPFPRTKFDDFHQSIPKNIREDYAESIRCRNVEAYKGTVSLCRRVIEAICFDKLREKIKNLKDMKLWGMIDALKNEGFITEHLKKTAHEIRHLGNYGAHFQDDELDKVTQEEAKEIQGFAEDLLHIIYITPYKTEEMKKKREAKEKND